MILAATQNLEGQLSVSVLTLVLTIALPAILLGAVIWVFWRASRNDRPPLT